MLVDVGYSGVVGVELAGQALYFGFGAAIDIVIEFAAKTVFSVLAILAHHNHRRLKSGQHGQKKIEQNKWIWIPGAFAQDQADRRIANQADVKSHNEGPRPADAGHVGGWLVTDRGR